MSLLPLLLLLLVSSEHNTHAQTITQGATITAGTTNSSWTSPSGDFAFGFYRLSNGNFLVGIWFDKIPEKTLVWSANRDAPVPASSTLRLTTGTSAGHLILTSSDGNSTYLYQSTAASSGYMQDDGNFVLKNASPSVLWQTFDSPTDTLLPGQVLVAGRKLYSNKNGTVDYSTGNFMLEMQKDSNLVLSAYHFADPGYWVSNTININNVSLVFNRTNAFMYLKNTTDIILPLTEDVPKPTEDYYHRVTLNDHGNLQQHVYQKNNSQWKMVWRVITEPCTVNAICGVYGICSSPDNETVSCDCLPGYRPLDPNNIAKGCYPKSKPDRCIEKPSLTNFTVEVIDDADFPNAGFADLGRVTPTDEEGCRKALMDDCYCMAASFVNSTCYKKRMPILNARISRNSTNGYKALIKVPKQISDGGGILNGDHHGGKKSVSRGLLKAGLFTTAAFALLFAALAVYYHPVVRRFIRRPRRPSADVDAMLINLRAFTFEELHEATCGFTTRLGRGSFGMVYSGTLVIEDKQIEIAVKALKKIAAAERGEEEFEAELRAIGRTHHRNLVRLLGFCNEDKHRILVYELMKNGTLSNLLFKQGEKPSWEHRVEMALGIARGVLYLHEECETQIIHCDIKPQNVLLDKNYTAKISDFGLAKIMMKDQTRTNTNVRGTAGYMAPEWLKNAPVTTKVDVYSFGVMLLEILCCRRHIDPKRVEEETEEVDLVLTEWIADCIKSGKLNMVVEEDMEALNDFKRFERMAMVGLWCVHPDPPLRPSMKKVTQMLEGTIEVGIPPLLYPEMV
ncbi:PREDICTED: G-type lectin S-receptor-like serine/threonine-protein kinase LECRK3 [Nelumbo nucifera]|uniref:Receptor-like serine/threonine-protein kinase n=2 Tax=Nelumbo nucifera TaxID=4432 RepID=A0A822YPY7_NELNU|nr:PREDICTED: G-type lectin S-receptor-like serine/threonine-protein kinase LECRK3 [Nelumbo nucifera]DAD33661.1 TPA_asm: hypothetical protein HUJ06_012512 [Nelumbo nucifera]